MLLRRTLLLSTAALLPLGLAAHAAPHAALTAQDQADIKRIEAYLNGLTTLKAHFMQVAQDGGVSAGHRLARAPRPHALSVRSPGAVPADRRRMAC